MLEAMGAQLILGAQQILMVLGAQGAQTMNCTIASPYPPWPKWPERHPSVKVVSLPTRETLFVALDHVLQCLTCVSTRVSPHSAIVSPHLCINSKSPSLVGHLGLKLVQPSPLSLSLEICHGAAADPY